MYQRRHFQIALGATHSHLAKLEFDYRSFPAIPLAVLDSEKLVRLRAAAAKYNLDPQKGGVLVQRAFIIENNDILDEFDRKSAIWMPAWFLR